MELIIVSSVVGLGIVLGLIMYPAFKVMPFAYGAARIRAAKSFLLSDDEMRSFAHKSYKDVVYHLEKKGFYDMLPLIETDFSESHVQRYLRKHSLDHMRKIIRYVPNRFKPFFEARMSKNDIDMIITVLRSKINPFHDRHILDSMFVETKYFNKKDLEDLNSMSLDDFFNKLKRTPFNEAVSKFQKEVKDGDLSGVEFSLNEYYYKSLLKHSRIDMTLRTYTRRLIDMYNVRESASFGDPRFISGGNLNHLHTRLSSAKDIKEIKEILDKTYLGPSVKDANTINEFTRALRRSVKEYAKNLLTKEPLSINPFVAYYILKDKELKNIRIILKLIHARFESEEIKHSII